MADTLEELENDVWGEPEFDSHLVTTCHKLRKKPIHKFTAENFRIMIGQNIGSKYLLPGAMALLREHPLTSGDFYNGDLLCSLINCRMVRSKADKILNAELAELCKQAIIQLEAEVLGSFDWENEPEHYGLTKKDANTSISAKLESLKSETPYKDFTNFINLK